MSQDKDQLLLNKSIAGDTKAYGQLVTKYQHMVYTLSLKVVGNVEEAEEVAQDSFLKAYKSLGSFKGDAKFSTWLYKITYHKCLDQLKKQKRNLEDTIIDAYADFEVSELENQWNELEIIERKVTIQEAIAMLSPINAVLITLFYFEELSLIEMSKILELEVNTVKVKLFRARKKLAGILRKKIEPEIIEGYERT